MTDTRQYPLVILTKKEQETIDRFGIWDEDAAE